MSFGANSFLCSCQLTRTCSLESTHGTQPGSTRAGMKSYIILVHTKIMALSSKTFTSLTLNFSADFDTGSAECKYSQHTDILFLCSYAVAILKLQLVWSSAMLIMFVQLYFIKPCVFVCLLVPLIQHLESRIMIPLKASPLQWGTCWINHFHTPKLGSGYIYIDCRIYFSLCQPTSFTNVCLDHKKV